MEKVTLESLIAQADTKKARPKKRITLSVKSLNGTIIIEEPEKATCLEALGMGEKGDDFIVYECCVEPRLKDQKLQSVYGCVEPLDIVAKIFLPGEIAEISGEAAVLAGYGGGMVTVVEDLKN
jgi:hypothetical protein